MIRVQQEQTAWNKVLLLSVTQQGLVELGQKGVKADKYSHIM